MADERANPDAPDEELRSLNLSDIAFPSDDLTIGMVRTAHPDLFDFGFAQNDEAQPRFFLQAAHSGHAQDTIGHLLHFERVIAAHVYAKARGISEVSGVDLDFAKDSLVDFYREYGLAHGIKQASELIRDIERQANDLGRQNGR